MNIHDLGFREIFNNFVLIKDVTVLGESASALPKEADGVLTYCFTDGDNGLSFLILAAISYADEKIIEDFNDKYLILRSPSLSAFEAKTANVETFDCEPFLNRCEEMNEKYEPEDEITDKIRDFEELDPLRSPDFPDDIMVYIYKNGIKAEGIWVKLTGITGTGKLKGKLLNEPDGDYGIHEGDEIDITLTKQGGDTVAYKMFGEA